MTVSDYDYDNDDDFDNYDYDDYDFDDYDYDAVSWHLPPYVLSAIWSSISPYRYALRSHIFVVKLFLWRRSLF